MEPGAFRHLALGFPEAKEKSHFGKADFRVRGRIFATLPSGEKAVLKLTPEEQRMVVSSEPALFAPVKGGWGLKGWTEIHLSKADGATLASVLGMAWRNAAPRALQRAMGVAGAERGINGT